MFLLKTHQTHNGPHFSHHLNASTLAAAKRMATRHKDLLCFDGQGHMDLYEVFEVEGAQHEIPQATGSNSAGCKNLRWC